MISKNFQKLLQDLEEVSTEYYLRNRLRLNYIPSDKRTEKISSHYFQAKEKKINYFFSQDWIKEFLKNKKKTIRNSSTVKPLKEDINIDFLAEKSALYFRQGLEFLRTSVNMPDNTAPLVEYYGFLQCAKAKIILSLDFDENLFFTKHGITNRKCYSEISKKRTICDCWLSPEIDVSQYLNGKIMPFGILPLLIISETSYYDETEYNKTEGFEMDKYLGRNYCPSLEEMLDQKHVGTIEAFIGSWMFSTLVRYQPKKWVDIRSGKNNDFNHKISLFRRVFIPKAISSMLEVYRSYDDYY